LFQVGAASARARRPVPLMERSCAISELFGGHMVSSTPASLVWTRKVKDSWKYSSMLVSS